MMRNELVHHDTCEKSGRWTARIRIKSIEVLCDEDNEHVNEDLGPDLTVVIMIAYSKLRLPRP